LTTYGDTESALDALAAGASGYLTKDAGRDDIRRALETAAAGQSVLDRDVGRRLVAQMRIAATPPAPLQDGLTPREREVLELMASGLSNQEIAARLVIGLATVKTPVNHVLAKTGARDRAQAIAYAYRTGVAPQDQDRAAPSPESDSRP
jgi:DNA-binding NarL/FixJ family response regulator